MIKRVATILMLAVALVGCDDVAREQTPVELIATVTQEVQRVDLADTECATLGTVELQSIIKNPNSNATFLDVRLQRMRVSYRRTDGGSMVPNSFVRTISGLVPQGGSAILNTFVVFQSDATSEAPFVALLPFNGGIDPETGRDTVQMDVILEIFGETVSGEPVAARVEFPLDFCYDCGGCV